MYLLDTNVISEIYKFQNGKIDPNVRRWLNLNKPSTTAISCISLAEIKTGILLKARKDKVQADLYQNWFEHQIISLFKHSTFEISTEIALLAAEYHIPNKMDLNDAYIGATAQFHRLTLVTRNIKDFEKLNIPLINPFE